MSKQTITATEAIHRIEQIYHANYDPHSDLSVWEQLEICEAIAPAAEELKKNGGTNEDVFVNGNDTYKRSINFKLTESKQKAIAELETCIYKTSPIRIAQLLETLFVDCNTKDGHWLYIAQHWNPRAINRVIKRMVELHNSGRITIQNPAAYFTYLINFRQKRRSL